jgi:hypothetical protein
MKGKRQILVKIEADLPNAKIRTADGAVDIVVPLNRAIAKKLKGARKGFFYAEVEGVGTTATLHEVKAHAPFQTW